MRREDRGELIWLWKILIYLVLIVAGAALLTGLASPFLPASFINAIFSFSAAAGVLGIIGVTAFVCGCALGFLFGLPRVTEEDIRRSASASAAPAGGRVDPSSAASQGVSYQGLRTNTTLEKISDWLSTMLVGVGLTQLNQINTLLLAFRGFLEEHAKVFDPHADQASAPTANMAAASEATAGLLPAIGPMVLIFGVVAGFLFMYLHTRLLLSPIMDNLERLLRRPPDEDRLREGANAALAADPRQQPPDVVAEAARVVATPPVANDADSLAKTGFAQVILGQVVPAAATLMSAWMLRPQDQKLRETTVRTLAVAKHTQEADHVLNSNAEQTPDDKLNRIFVALYKDPPAGFTEAIRLSDELIADAAANTRAEYWFYRAAAYGQKYHNIRSAVPVDANAVTEAHDQVIASAGHAVAIDQSFKQRLAWLATADGEDNDLADFAQDPAFRAIIS